MKERFIFSPFEGLDYCPRCSRHLFVINSPKSKRCHNCGFELFMNTCASYVAFIVNSRGELLVERRKFDPAKGTLDLPGGFADAAETAEEGVAREVKEETGLKVTSARYLFSLPNLYRYSDIDIPTLDLFFECEVADEHAMRAADDAEECMWMPLSQLDPAEFGLKSVAEGLARYLSSKA